MNITYRQWKTEDAEQVRHILHETWLDAYAPFIPEEDLIGYLDVHYSIDSIKKFSEDPNIVGFIAEADCVAVGCVKTHYNKEEVRLYVQQLYILPKYQGLGVGRRLMELSAERAKSLGLDRVWLGVMVRNQQAVEWYKKMGYEIIETTPFTMGKTTVDHYIGYVHIDRIIKNLKLKDFLFSKVYGIFNSESSIGALPKLCLDLIDRQKKDWSLLADNYNMFQQVHVREINCNGFNVNVQWNPKRIVSTSADVDQKSIEERECFLCLDHLPTPQKGILYRDEFLILCNPAPIFNQHFTVSSVTHLPQNLEQNVRTMLNLARDLNPNFTVFYNGPKCGASAPDHLHFQVGPRGAIPIERDAVDAHRRRILCKENLVAALTLKNYGRSVLIIESTDENELVGFIGKMLNSWKQLVGTTEEPMFNALCSYREQVWRMMFFPRRKHRPDVYFKEGDERVLVSPAAVDIGGLVIMPLEKDFIRVDALMLEAIFSEVCFGGEFVEQITKQLKMD